jgi:hypothetical protein
MTHRLSSLATTLLLLSLGCGSKVVIDQGPGPDGGASYIPFPPRPPPKPHESGLPRLCFRPTRMIVLDGLSRDVNIANPREIAWQKGTGSHPWC